MTRKARSAEGRMPLGDHLRELRARLIRSFLAVLAGGVVSFVFFNPIWKVLRHPYCQVHQPTVLENSAQNCGALVYSSLFDPIMWHFKVALIGGLILASPVWLYQLWAFVTPGLKHNERKYSLAFIGVAVPLFAGGATLAYFVMAKGLNLLLNFAPAGTTSLISIDHYLSYALAMLVMFGASFDIPLLIVMLNMIGVLSYARLKKARRVTIFLVFVFAAVATPSGDPVTMCALGVPLLVLMEVATQIARVHDARKARIAATSPLANLSDDQISPLDIASDLPTG